MNVSFATPHRQSLANWSLREICYASTKRNIARHLGVTWAFAWSLVLLPALVHAADSAQQSPAMTPPAVQGDSSTPRISPYLRAQREHNAEKSRGQGSQAVSPLLKRPKKGKNRGQAQ